VLKISTTRLYTYLIYFNLSKH